MTESVSKILAELKAHPKEKEGFSKEDFDVLSDHERRILVEPFVAEVGDGDSTAAAPLQWLLRERHVPELERWHDSLPAGAPGRVFLPYWLHEATGDRSYLMTMMREIVAADPNWSRRRQAVSGYLRRAIGQNPLFWDFCRYLILNDADPLMRKTAMVWLAQEKGYPLIELTLDDTLKRCLAGMIGPGAPTTDALGILDSLHRDSGLFLPEA